MQGVRGQMTRSSIRVVSRGPHGVSFLTGPLACQVLHVNIRHDFNDINADGVETPRDLRATPLAAYGAGPRPGAPETQLTPLD